MKSNKIMPLLCILMVGTALLIWTGCSDNSSSNNTNPANDPAEPAFEEASFNDAAMVDNRFLPLNPGTVQLYQVETEDGVETIVVEVLDDTRVVNGLTSVVVRDREFLDELLIENTTDWYAQDDKGNVWYMGEDVTNYEYDDDENLIGTDNEGAWEAGVERAYPVSS